MKLPVINHPDYVAKINDDNKFPPSAYITSVGMYSPEGKLLAVAKLSEPLKKTPENELTVRVRLDY